MVCICVLLQCTDVNVSSTTITYIPNLYKLRNGQLTRYLRFTIIKLCLTCNCKMSGGVSRAYFHFDGNCNAIRANESSTRAYEVSNTPVADRSGLLRADSANVVSETLCSQCRPHHNTERTYSAVLPQSDVNKTRDIKHGFVFKLGNRNKLPAGL